MTIHQLNRIGWWIYIPFLVLTLRLTWEKIYLTWAYGPQNIGFALAHGYFSLLFISVIPSLVWMVATLILILLHMRRKKVTGKEWALWVVTVITWIIFLMPFERFISVIHPK